HLRWPIWKNFRMSKIIETHCLVQNLITKSVEVFGILCVRQFVVAQKKLILMHRSLLNASAKIYPAF
ncbi:MAG: hypothetical protein K8F24_11645, partial [Bacteroidales bacterium]|nr:hypothetical protein [Bacteroidales bacterium]